MSAEGLSVSLINGCVDGRFCRTAWEPRWSRGAVMRAVYHRRAPGLAPEFSQYVREIVYERRVRLALFRLDIDNVLILFIRAHLAQEFLKLAATFLTHFALKLSERFINRLWRGE